MACFLSKRIYPAVGSDGGGNPGFDRRTCLRVLNGRTTRRNAQAPEIAREGSPALSRPYADGTPTPVPALLGGGSAPAAGETERVHAGRSTTCTSAGQNRLRRCTNEASKHRTAAAESAGRRSHTPHHRARLQTRSPPAPHNCAHFWIKKTRVKTEMREHRDRSAHRDPATPSVAGLRRSQ